eukprot:UN3392
MLVRRRLERDKGSFPWLEPWRLYQVRGGLPTPRRARCRTCPNTARRTRSSRRSSVDGSSAP